MSELQTVAPPPPLASFHLQTWPAGQGGSHIALAALAMGANANDDKVHKIDMMVRRVFDISHLQVLNQSNEHCSPPVTQWGWNRFDGGGKRLAALLDHPHPLAKRDAAVSLPHRRRRTDAKSDTRAITSSTCWADGAHSQSTVSPSPAYHVSGTIETTSPPAATISGYARASA